MTVSASGCPGERGRGASEAVFVPAAGATDEDAGCLLTVVSDLNADASRMLVLDASDLSLPPVATVHLPRRVPAMIHGSWIPDTAAGWPLPPTAPARLLLRSGASGRRCPIGGGTWRTGPSLVGQDVREAVVRSGWAARPTARARPAARPDRAR